MKNRSSLQINDIQYLYNNKIIHTLHWNDNNMYGAQQLTSHRVGGMDNLWVACDIY